MPNTLCTPPKGKIANEDEDEDDEEEGGGAPKTFYHVVGTLSRADAVAPRWVKEVVDYDPTQKEALKDTLLGCQSVIWDIATPDQVDGCSWAVEMLRDEMESFAENKLFLCISSVLTWGKTRSADPEDAEAPILEEEYRRRRPHNRSKTHIDCEKLVIKCGRKTKGKFKTYVAASGLQYGAGEDVFHALFKSAWHQHPPALPVFGPGTNVVPTIHVHDLAALAINVIESQPETKYLVAIDESRSTLLELTTAIAEALGTRLAPTPPLQLRLGLWLERTRMGGGGGGIAPPQKPFSPRGGGGSKSTIAVSLSYRTDPGWPFGTFLY